jgi:DNA integrity scanning protein DisA with diadenylate cyclase activity
MDNLLEEYKLYYSVRAKRFENNPNYINSFQTEKELSDTMQSCNTLEEFKIKLDNKNEMCAIALVKDESIIENKFYIKHKETVRKLASERILAKINTVNNTQDLITMVLDEYNKNGIEISMDDAHKQLLYDWKLLEEYEIYSKAVVPDKYKQDMLKSAEESKETLLKNVAYLEQQNNAWQTGWKINPKIGLEERHISWFPFKPEHVKEQTEKYAKLSNR